MCCQGKMLAEKVSGNLLGGKHFSRSFFFREIVWSGKNVFWGYFYYQQTPPEQEMFPDSLCSLTQIHNKQSMFFPWKKFAPKHPGKPVQWVGSYAIAKACLYFHMMSEYVGFLVYATMCTHHSTSSWAKKARVSISITCTCFARRCIAHIAHAHMRVRACVRVCVCVCVCVCARAVCRQGPFYHNYQVDVPRD